MGIKAFKNNKHVAYDTVLWL